MERDEEGLLLLEGLQIEEEGEEGSRTDRAQELLAIFSKVRDRLHREGGITALPLDFPIRELNHDNYMGITYTRHGNWKEVGRRRIALENVVESIGMRLRYQNSRKCYDLNTLLATLLHEFAHAITRGEMLNGHTEEGRRCRGWHDVAHTDEFYANFALILEKAEALDIFTLPGDPRSKFTKKNLIKYDKIDSQVTDLKGEVEGEEEDTSLPRFLQSEVNSGDPLQDEAELQARPHAQEPLRLTLSRNGQRKMVVLSPRTMSELAKVVKQKFRMKAYKATDGKGKTFVDDADLAQLAQDSVLIIAGPT